MRQTSHPMSARTVRTAKAVAVGPSSPRPVAARSATTISTRLFPPLPARTPPKSRPRRGSGTSPPRSPAGCGASTSEMAPQRTPPGRHLRRPARLVARRPRQVPARPPTTESKQRATDRRSREREVISPAMRRVESHDADRHLVGFDDRLKGLDRIKEKVWKDQGADRSPTRPCHLFLTRSGTPFSTERTAIPRASGRRQRLKDQGFGCADSGTPGPGEYKGINSQWVEPDSGQRFEVQFHTCISFEAKQLTHRAYGRLRTRQTDSSSRWCWKRFSEGRRRGTVPRSAATIPDYPERGADAR